MRQQKMIVPPILTEVPLAVNATTELHFCASATADSERSPTRSRNMKVRIASTVCVTRRRCCVAACQPTVPVFIGVCSFLLAKLAVAVRVTSLRGQDPSSLAICMHRLLAVVAPIFTSRDTEPFAAGSRAQIETAKAATP